MAGKCSFLLQARWKLLEKDVLCNRCKERASMDSFVRRVWEILGCVNREGITHTRNRCSQTAGEWRRTGNYSTWASYWRDWRCQSASILCSLFQALSWWGRSKKRACDERGLIEKRALLLFSRTPLIARPLFRSSLLTERHEQARFYGPFLSRRAQNSPHLTALTVISKIQD